MSNRSVWRLTVISKWADIDELKASLDVSKGFEGVKMHAC